MTTTPSAPDLPPGFLASQVDSLYSDARSFVIGAAAACASALTVALRTGSGTVYAVVLLLALLCAARLGAMRIYRRPRPTPLTTEALRLWELSYQLGAAAHVTLLGVYCVATFATTQDPFDRLLAFVSIMAYLTGTPGRNFASAFGVDIQIVCGAVPTFASMAIAGGVYWLVSLIVLVPFFLAARGIAARLRGIFVQAVTRAHDLSLLAGRFDTALSNMPHGLAMFDAGGRVVVHNRRLPELLRLDPDADYKGASVGDLLARCGADRGAAISRIGAFEDQLSSPTPDILGLDVPGGPSIAFTFQSMRTGGAVVLAQDVTERQRAEARINQLALYDPLTNLPNRVHFRALFEAAVAGDAAAVPRHALLFVDLDQFKQVNDTLGHSRGDMLLCEVAERLRETLRHDDAVARFGGDEFVILRRAGGGGRDPLTLARTLIDRISRPYAIDGNTVMIGASVGIAFLPDHGTAFDVLLKEADTALYRAKADGRGTWKVFEPSMDVEARARRDLEVDLRHALRNGEFEVFFQPIFNLAQRRFTVCEALLRWNHPVRGRVSPAEFIPVAEEMGLIVEIGTWVLRQACFECAMWPADVHVAVNISPLQFRRGGIIPAVREALADAGLPAHRLELELTESVVLQDLGFTTVTMQHLHDMKVGISLDDFGTGYSSLSYLHTLPLTKVKIDRSFLEGLGTSERTRVILRGVARLSVELGLSVVIEGVETEAQLALVSTEGDIGEVQGFLFSRPVPSQDIRPLLAASAARAA